jgi:hypothetical protein
MVTDVRGFWPCWVRQLLATPAGAQTVTLSWKRMTNIASHKAAGVTPCDPVNRLARIGQALSSHV